MASRPWSQPPCNSVSEYFRVGILTDPVLQVGLMIAYVYLVCLLIFALLRVIVRWLVDLAGWSNFLWLRNAIARERGIEAYRAWVPLERIRPAHIPQEQWEAAFAWPPDNKPPYPPLAQRIGYGLISYVVVIARRRRSAPAVHAVSGAELARQVVWSAPG